MKLHLPILSVCLILMFLSTAASQPGRVSKTLDDTQVAELVKAEFLHAWNAYKRYAWGHEHLKPLSRSYDDWHTESLMTTAVDALDTMILMGFREEAEKTRDFIVEHLSFDKDVEVKNFEITIRLLGGLLSGYQLMGDDRLLKLADDLGRRLLPVFESPTGMPYMYVNLRTGAVREAVSNPAEIGTLLIEFGTLSKLTGNPVYYEKAKRALVEVFSRRSSIGLVGEQINVETGRWVDSSSHVGGRIDSYYEYLLKCWLLFDDKDCERMWKESVAALHKHLADEVPSGLWYGRVDMMTGKREKTWWGGLEAFLPAVLALGGDLDRAKRLQESSYKMWNLAGVEPELIDYSTMKILNAGYPLRPEIMESAYYLLFFTGDSRYREMGRTFLESLLKYCRTENGYAALRNVETKEQKDEMESFFLAETLKYLYLIFAPRETLDLHTVVFNTEAHPIRRTW
ncbi:MAG: glycoside hydrolase family 47 protein [Bacteroidota bacterium]